MSEKFHIKNLSKLYGKQLSGKEFKFPFKNNGLKPLRPLNIYHDGEMN